MPNQFFTELSLTAKPNPQALWPAVPHQDFPGEQRAKEPEDSGYEIEQNRIVYVSACVPANGARNYEQVGCAK